MGFRPKHLNIKAALLRGARKPSVFFVTIAIAIAGLVSPAHAAGTLTNVNINLVSLAKGVSGNRIDLSFNAGTSADVGDIDLTIPTGVDVSPYNRALLLSTQTDGNYASTPNATANDVSSSDIDVRAKVSFPDWYGGTIRYLLSKRADPGMSYSFAVNALNELELGVSDSSGSPTFIRCALPTGWASNSTHWLRATNKLSTGKENFYVSTDGLNWTSICSGLNGPSSRYSSSLPIAIGAMSDGTDPQFAAISRVELRKTIDGAPSMVFDASQASAASPLSWNSAGTGEAWTVNRAGSDVKADIGGIVGVTRLDGFTSQVMMPTLRLSEKRILVWLSEFHHEDVGQQSGLSIGGLVFDRSVSSFNTVVKTWNNSTMIDQGTSNTVTFSEPTVQALAGNHDLIPTTDVPANAVRFIPQQIAKWNNYIYIAESNIPAVLRLDLTTGMIRRVVSNGDMNPAVPGSDALATGLNGIGGVAVDANGDIYLSERWEGRVLRVDHVTNKISVEVDSLNEPMKLAFNQAAAPNKLAVGNIGNGTVTVATGSAGGRNSSKSNVATGLTVPMNLAYASNGDLYVTDQSASGRFTKIDTSNNVTHQGSHTCCDTSLAIDPGGNAYWADANVNKINRSTNLANIEGSATVVAGTGEEGFSGDGGPATSAVFDAVYSMLVDSNGDLYLADYDNGRIRKIDTGGTITSIAGQDVVAPGQAMQAKIHDVGAMIVDSNQNLLVSNTNYGWVASVDPNNRVTTFAGSPARDGVLSNNGDGGQATAARLNFVTGMARDSAGNTYLANGYMNEVRKVAPNGVISTFANGFSSQLEAIVVLPPKGANNPNGDSVLIALHDNTLWSVSASGVKTKYAGTAGSTTAGGEAVAYGSGSVKFVGIEGMASAPNGDIFICDSAANTVRRISAGIITTVAGKTPTDANEGTLANKAQLNHPGAIAIAPDGTVFVANQYEHKIRAFKPAGKIFTVVGAGGLGESGDGGPTSAAQIGNVSAIAFRGRDLVFSTFYNSYLRVIKDVIAEVPAVNNDVLTAQTGIATQLSLNSNDSADGSYIDATTTEIMSQPTHAQYVKIDPDLSGVGVTQLVYVSAPGYTGPDSLKYRTCDATRTSCRTATVNITVGPGEVRNIVGGPNEGRGDVNGAPGSVVAKNGRFLYELIDNNTVHRIDPWNSQNENYAGNGTNFVSGDGGPAANAGIGDTTSIAFDARGVLYLLSSTNGTIRKVETDGTITTFAGLKGGSTADGTPSSSYDFSNATAIEPDLGNAYGAMFVAFANKIVSINPSNNWAVTTVAGTGVAGFGGASGSATSAQLNGVTSLSSDINGTLYFADKNNQAIRALANNKLTTVAGTLGSAGDNGDGGPATAAKFNTPCGVTVGLFDGVLYVSDTGNNRVRKVVVGGNITAFAGDGSATGPTQNGAATAVRISGPTSIVRLDTDRLGVIEGGNGTLRAVSPGYTYAVAQDATDMPVDSHQVRIGPDFGYGLAMSPDEIVFSPRGGRLGVTSTTNASRPHQSGTVAATPIASGRIGAMVPDGAGGLYFTDVFAHQVKFRAADGTVSVFAGTGVQGADGNGGPASSATFVLPYGLARAKDGTMFVSDLQANQVRKIAPNGIISTYAGDGGQGYSGEGIKAVDSQFNQPAGIALDSVGNLFIADTYNNRVAMVDTAGYIVTTMGNGSAGSALNPTGDAEGSQLNHPVSVYVTADDDLYIGDDSGFISQVNQVGEVAHVVGTGAMGYNDNGSLNATQIGTVGAFVEEPATNSLYFLDNGANKIRRIKVTPTEPALNQLDVHVIPSGPGHSADQYAVSFTPAKDVDSNGLGIWLPGVSGSPTVISAFGVPNSSLGATDIQNGGLHISFNSTVHLVAGVRYQFTATGLTVSTGSIGSTAAALVATDDTYVAYGRTNIVDLRDGLPTVGEAGFATVGMPSSAVAVGGAASVQVEPAGKPQASFTRTVTQGGNLNGSDLSVSLGAMTGPRIALPMLGTTGVAPASQPKNTWGISVSGGTEKAPWSGGQLAGTSGPTLAAGGITVNNPVSVGFSAKVDYLQPAGRYQSTWILGTTKGS